jgi:hypothetical protein
MPRVGCAPLDEERDGGSSKADLGEARSGIFLREGLDRVVADLPVGHIIMVYRGPEGPDGIGTDPVAWANAAAFR